jgi:hypothetical protein
MEKAETKQISDFVSDVYEGICEQDPPQLKVLLASLEKKARQCKQQIEARLAMRN